MKLIFLDFDGVLTNEASGTRPQRYPNDCADLPCVRALNRITNTTGASIVISSSWRTDSMPVLTALLRKWGVTGAIVGRTPEIKGHPFDAPRHEEIEAYLWRIGSLHSFVILDDEKIGGKLAANWVQTKFHDGLTEADATRAIAILDRGEGSLDAA